MLWSPHIRTIPSDSGAAAFSAQKHPGAVDTFGLYAINTARSIIIVIIIVVDVVVVLILGKEKPPGPLPHSNLQKGR